MKISTVSSVLALLCSTVAAQKSAITVIGTLATGIATLNPTLITLITVKPISSVTPTTIPVTCTNTTVTVIKTDVLTVTLPGVTVTSFVKVPVTVTGTGTCTNSTVYVVKTDYLTVTLPPVTVTNTTVITRTGTVTATITQPCPSTTGTACPDPCTITKTYEGCEIAKTCQQWVSTTMDCKCPTETATCRSVVYTETCLTCPPVGIKTIPCSSASPVPIRF